MINRSIVRAILASTTLAGGTLAAPATAQVAPVRQSIDVNGVDLFLGTMNADGPTLSAGQNAQGMTWRKTFRGLTQGDSITSSLTVGSVITVGLGGKTDRFTISGATYTSTEGDGATLSLSGNIYTYTAADGTVAHFDKTMTSRRPELSETIGLLTDLTKPTGETLTYTFESMVYCVGVRVRQSETTCLGHATVYRFATAQSNAGYKLTFNNAAYSTDPNDYYSTDWANWGTVNGVSMTNTAVTGASVRAQNFSYSSGGGNNYLTITDALSRATVYRNTADGVAGIKLPGSSAEDVTVTYSSGKVASVTNPIGTTTYGYADAGGVRTVTVTDPAGKATVYTFDIASQRMTSKTDATSRTTQWTYDTSGRVTRTTAPEGNYVQATYDTRGNVTEARGVAKSGSGVSDIVSTASYDSSCTNAATCNQPNSTTDARGSTTDYTYDATSGEVLTVTAPAPTTGATRPKTTYTYTSVNGVSVLDTSSVCRTTASCAGTSDETKTLMTYNANGLPASKTVKAGDSSLSATTAIGYNDVGDVTSADGPLSGTDDTVSYRYDADRERVGTIAPDPDGSGPLARAATRTTYNVKGQATETELGTVAGTGDSDWAGFSSAQQATATLDAAGRTTRSVLTAGGTTYGVTEYSFDLAGRPDCVAVRMNPSAWGTATAACTAATAGSNGPDRIARTTYDDAGRPLTKVSAYGISGVQSIEVTVTYTGNGEVATATDAESNKTTYEYDGVDRLAKTRYPSTTKSAGTSSTTDYEQLSYDAGSNVTSRRLRDGNSIGYTYDALNRLTAKDLPGSELDVAYTYDLLDRPLSAVTSAQTLSFTYDALGRNLTQVGPQGTVTSAYDLAGRRTQLTYPGSFYVTYDYDVTGNMTAIKESGSTTLATYAYDDLGRRTTLTLGNGVVSSYGFDNVSRLTSLGLNLSGTTDDQTLGFSYNTASQIAGTTRSNDGYAWTGAASVTRAYTSNGLNQLTASGATSLGYDTRGNLTTSGSDTYTYSSENLLLTGPGSAALSYDPLLRLYQTSATGFTTTRFAYDGQSMIAEYNSSNALQKRYVFGPGGDEPLVEYDSGGTKTYLTADERGSVVSRTNSSGVATAKNSYDEYGIPGAGNAGRFGYTGQAWLPELGMAYYKARMYSPTLGRFMQTDPIGYGDGMNWYNYVKGDPVNRGDPSGLCDHGEYLGVVTGSRIRKCLPIGYESADGSGDGSGGSSGGGSGGGGSVHGGYVGCVGCSTTSDDGESIVITGKTLAYVSDQFFSISYSIGLSERFNSNEHYCGSNGFNVPDGNWKEACAAHDECYGGADSSKEGCDFKLWQDMTALCNIRTGGAATAECSTVGFIYFTGLLIGGWHSFNEAQKGR